MLCSGGDETFIGVIWLVVCCCMMGDGLICVKTPVPSTMPAIELCTGRLMFKLLQFSFTIVIGGCCTVEHFISMGTVTGGREKESVCVNINCVAIR